MSSSVSSSSSSTGGIIFKTRSGSSSHDSGRPKRTVVHYDNDSFSGSDSNPQQIRSSLPVIFIPTRADVTTKKDSRDNDVNKNSSDSKTWNVAMKYFEVASGYISEASSYIPFVGTFVGLRHAYTLFSKSEQNDGQRASESSVDRWEKAKVVTEIFSFLLIPQVCYGIAKCVDYFIDRRSVHTKPLITVD